jgi:hypothetical protein
VFTDGKTIVVPEEAKVPTPGLIVTEVAFDTFQLKVAGLPTVIPEGLAVKELTTGRPADDDGAPETMTWAVAVVLLPAALVAVRVYTVVALGITALLPVKATLPIPWSMLTVLAPETLQLSVEDSPAEMLSGLASKELIAGCWPEVLIVTGPLAKSQPAVNTITISRTKGINFFMLHLPDNLNTPRPQSQ